MRRGGGIFTFVIFRCCCICVECAFVVCFLKEVKLDNRQTPLKYRHNAEKTATTFPPKETVKTTQ